jgi:hypothetical protein
MGRNAGFIEPWRPPPFFAGFSSLTAPGLQHREECHACLSMAKQTLNRFIVNSIIALQKHGFLIFQALYFNQIRLLLGLEAKSRRTHPHAPGHRSRQ